MRFLPLGVLVPISIAVWFRTLLQAMPAPFDDLVAETVPAERIELYPGGSNGSAIPPRFTGAFQRNELLKDSIHLFDGAPLYIGPGRPLGFHLVGEDDLFVCDSLKGLLHVSLSSGAIEIISNVVSAAGGAAPQPLNYANDLDIGKDGTVYFTSCTDAPVARNSMGFYDTMFSYLLAALRGAADGRLLRWDPTTRETTVLARGLAFANGVALSSDESWVAVVETNLARVHRYWLRGSRRGQMEVLVGGLPGMPDGISRSADGGFWVGLVAPLTPLSHVLGPYRWLRQLVSHAIRALSPLVVKRWGAVVKLDAAGRPIRTLYDLDGSHVGTVSAVTEHKGRLFFGNLGGDYVSYLDV